MSNPLQPAIDALKADIAEAELKILPLKAAVNTLCRKLGLPDEYQIDDLSGTGPREIVLSWRLDQFVNRSLAGCVAEILGARRDAGLDGPASIDEIFDALMAGGFKFQGTSGSDENTKRAIKIALTKNTAQFVKIRDDIFGLKKWYGASRGSSVKRSSKPSKSPSDSSGEDDPEPEDSSEQENAQDVDGFTDDQSEPDQDDDEETT